MDRQNLESIRDTAQIHVQRCLATCHSSATCRHRHKPRHTHKSELCSRHLGEYTRFVKEVMQGGNVADSAAAAYTYAFGLTQTAIDQNTNKNTKRQTVCEAFIQKAMRATRHGSAATRTTAALQSGDRLSMKLTERKQKLIDKHQKIRSKAKKAFSTGQTAPQNATQTEKTKGDTLKQSLGVMDKTKHKKTEAARGMGKLRFPMMVGTKDSERIPGDCT